MAQYHHVQYAVSKLNGTTIDLPPKRLSNGALLVGLRCSGGGVCACGLLRGDTQCDHPTTSFNYDVLDLHLLQIQSKLLVGEFNPAHL